jgi:hypothetical protein
MTRHFKVAAIVILLAICAASAIVQGYRQRQRERIRPTELFNVIWQQVAAFRADDYAGAYRQVSNNFQERFNIDAFTDLIHSDYPPLRLAERVEFGAVRWDGERAIVPAYFFMPDHVVIPCFYSLVEEDGIWKIDAVHVMKKWRPGQRLGGLRA